MVVSPLSGYLLVMSIVTDVFLSYFEDSLKPVLEDTFKRKSV